MKIIIYGSGGVGGYFGAKLARAGHQVTFIARGAHLNAIQQNGLEVKSINGNFTLEKVAVTNCIETIKESPDLIIIAVKAWQVKEAAQNIKPLLKKETIVLPLENGITAPEIIAKEIGKAHVLCGLCRIFSKIEAPGVINHMGIDPSITFGEFDNAHTPRTQQVLELFNQAEINAFIPKDIYTAMWKKFLIICTLSGIGAITRTPIGPARDNPITSQLIKEMSQEIINVGIAKGAKFNATTIDQHIENILNTPYKATASMQRDIMEGKPSELEDQNGAIVKLGEELGIATPINRFIYGALLPQEFIARG